MKGKKSGGSKKGATPAPAEKPAVTELVGWRPGDKFEETNAVGLMKVSELVKAKAKKNPREWGARNLRALQRSIDRLGILNWPIINRRTGRLIAGHMRVEALVRLKWPTCPVRYEDMDAETERLARIQDNNRYPQGRWKEEVVDHLKDIEKLDRELYVQFELGNILEQLANQDSELQDSEPSDRERSEGDGEGYVNLTFRLPASAGMMVKAKVDAMIAAKGLVGKTAKGQALELLVANGDPAHRCATELDIRRAVDLALNEAAVGKRTMPTAEDAKATLEQLGVSPETDDSAR